MLSRSNIALLLIVLAGIAAYANSFSGLFVYDDFDSIVNNPHIERLWPPSSALSVPLWGTAATVDRRPVLSLSFALNHALFGPEPWGYHLVNLAIHIAAGLLLFGVVRRTARCSVIGDQYSERGGKESVQRSPDTDHWKLNTDQSRSTALALSIALLWLVHPLHTSAVTYIVQRAESLMGMFYLLTVYCAIRGFAAGEVSGVRCQVSGGEEKRKSLPSLITDHRSLITGARGRWHTAAILACALGMGTKEVMATAPIVVLLYDFVFVSGSFRAALRRHWGLYAGLAATWFIVAASVLLTFKNVQADIGKVTFLEYALSQPGVVVRYLRLAFWPRPLVLSYNWPVAKHMISVAPNLLLLFALFAAAAWGLWRRRWWGFAGAWFFLILAPTSSVITLGSDLAFEHRMYLPLAGVITLMAMLANRICNVIETVGHASRRDRTDTSRRAGWSPLERRPTSEETPTQGMVRAVLPIALLLPVFIALGITTHQRNKDYHNRIRLWEHNVRVRPDSYHAHANLGHALAKAGRLEEAIGCYREAVRLKPDFAGAFKDWGNALRKLGRDEEVMARYHAAVDADPDYFPAYLEAGQFLADRGRTDEAIRWYRKAIEVEPGFGLPYNSLGMLYSAQGKLKEAIACYEKGIAAEPGLAMLYVNLGATLTAVDRAREAIPRFERAVALDPQSAAAYYNWGNALVKTGRLGEAVSRFQRAIEIDPGFSSARKNLQAVLKAIGQEEEIR